MTSAEILEPEIAATPATETQNDASKYEALNPFRAGPGPLDRVPEKDRGPLDKAERAVESAKLKADTIRQELSTRQTALESLRQRHDRAKGKLARLRAIDPDAGLQRAEEIVEQLYGNDLTPPEMQTLHAAMNDLVLWPKLKEILPGMIERKQAVVAEIEKQLAALEGK
jgi:multidrug resistance efflux pump